MKNFKLIILGFLIFSMILGCSKDEEGLQFGETLSDFKTDSVYFSSTDGLLNVEYESDGHSTYLGNPIAIIFADENPNPITEIGIVYYSTTIPIRKNLYWKVKRLNMNIINIRWTPVY